MKKMALLEIKVLGLIKAKDSLNSFSIVKMVDFFYFNNKICILFELLSINLYDLIKENNFQGMPM